MKITNIVLNLIFVILTVSCVSTTTIKAMDSKGNIDKDVKIYVEGKHIGNGTAEYSDKKTVYSSIPYLELKKEGCKKHREKLDIEANWLTSLGGAVISGIGLGIMSAGAEQAKYPGSDASDYLLIGFPISIAGIIPLFWTRKYVPIQEQEFQCIKVSGNE